MRSPLRIPRVIAHRGASHERPENTRAAFDEALRQGAEAIELDVQLSRDGVPFVYHDRSLSRVGGGRRRLAHLAAEELAGLDAGGWFDRRYSDERLLSLRQALARYGKQVELLIEIKARRPGDPRHRELTEAVLGELRRAEKLRRCFLLCFDRKVLDTAAGIAPDLPRVWNLQPPRRPWSDLAARLQGLDAVSVDIRKLTPEFAAAVRAAGVPLFSYTTNRSGLLQRNIECGVDGIMSDRPAWLRRGLEQVAGDAR